MLTRCHGIVLGAAAAGVVTLCASAPLHAEELTYPEWKSKNPPTRPVVDEGMQPIGYQLGHKSSSAGFMIGGIMFGLGYGATLLAGAVSASAGEDRAARLMVPIIGPILYADYKDEETVAAFGITLFQAAGVAALVAGAVGTDVWVRNDLVAVTIVPSVGVDGAPGVGLLGRF